MASLLRYALDTEGKLVFVKHVANGLACNCVCPHCKSRLIARNGGEKREAHFAHEKGSDCGEGYETALHLLAKEIISKEKKIMCPTYKGLDIPLTNQCTFQSVEVEERNDSNDLQPDCVGVTEDGIRIHIEIFVTHRVDDDKMAKLKKENLNCMEINISRDFPDEIELLTDYLVNTQENRTWINFPYGEIIWVEEDLKRKKDNIINYRNHHKDEKAINSEKCESCMIFKEKIKEALYELVKSYRKRLLPWAVSITELSFEEIISKGIHLEFTSSLTQAPYVVYNERKNYIYPKNEKFNDSEHKRLCNSTYGFFKNLTVMAEMYKQSELYHDQCYFFKKEFEYNGAFYTFCSKNKNKVIPLDYWKNIEIINDFFIKTYDLKDRQKRIEFVKIMKDNR